MSALAEIESDRIMTLILERWDESLVVLTHYLNWSLADVVSVMPKKALSSHPGVKEWPLEGITLLEQVLLKYGERAVYDAGVAKLNQRIADLSLHQVNVTHEVIELRRLRSISTEVCLRPEVLSVYKAFLDDKNYISRVETNKFRDVDTSLVESGHAFSFCGTTFYSFDICGPCEAHAHSLFGRSFTQLTLDERGANIVFENCPKFS